MDGLFYCGVPASCVLVWGLVHDAKHRSRQLRRERELWGEYAAGRGFRYSSATSTYSLRTQHRVEGRVDGLPLTCMTGLGLLQMPTTTISARAPVPVEGRLYVSCDDALSRAADDELARKVDVDDPDFNGPTFGVKATAPGLAEIVLSPHVRRLLVRMAHAGRASLNFRCDRDLVVVEWMGHEPIRELLDLGFDLVVAVSTSRTRVGAYR